VSTPYLISRWNRDEVQDKSQSANRESRHFQNQKAVMEMRTIKVGGKTYKRLKKWNNRPYIVEEIVLYEEILDEWDG